MRSTLYREVIYLRYVTGYNNEVDLVQRSDLPKVRYWVSFVCFVHSSLALMDRPKTSHRLLLM